MSGVTEYLRDPGHLHSICGDTLEDEPSVSLSAGSVATWMSPCLWVIGAGCVTFLNHTFLILKIGLIMVPASGLLG